MPTSRVTVTLLWLLATTSSVFGAAITHNSTKRHIKGLQNNCLVFPDAGGEDCMLAVGWEEGAWARDPIGKRAAYVTVFNDPESGCKEIYPQTPVLSNTNTGWFKNGLEIKPTKEATFGYRHTLFLGTKDYTVSLDNLNPNNAAGYPDLSFWYGDKVYQFNIGQTGHKGDWHVTKGCICDGPVQNKDNIEEWWRTCSCIFSCGPSKH